MGAMGPPLLVRSGEEHSGPHNAWFWDPERQGGGVMSDMGCHCLAVGWYALTPPGKGARLSAAEVGHGRSVAAQVGTARDGASGCSTGSAWITADARRGFRHRHGHLPEPRQRAIASKASSRSRGCTTNRGCDCRSTDSVAGYAFEMNTLRSPLELFIGDEAAEGVADAEAAMEKSTASRGLLAVQPNEADLYGYTDENVDAATRF